MWFSTGKPHPLASRPTLEFTVAGASAYNLSDTEVIGDYILYWVGAPLMTRPHDGSLCTIYLVAWKEGWVKEVRFSPLRLLFSDRQFTVSFAPPTRVCMVPFYLSYPKT
jgi:hypothetical protein